MNGDRIIEGLLTSDGLDDPYPWYAEAHERGDVLPIWGDKLMAVGYRAVYDLLRDPDFGSATAEVFTEGVPVNPSRQVIGRSLIKANDPDHTRVRPLIASLFTPRRLAAMAPMVADVVRRLLDRLADEATDDVVDFMDAFGLRLPLDVMCGLFGVHEYDHRHFRALVSDISWSLEPNPTPEGLLAADVATGELVSFLGELVAERRSDLGTDLVSDLIRLTDAEGAPLPVAELLANLLLLLVAGSETTTDWLGNCVAVAFADPAARAAMCSGAVRTDAFSEEVLRYDSPSQVVPRVPLRSGLSVAGHPAPPGTAVLLMLGAANRDPARYPRPDVFDPDRPDNQPLSFGFGPHFCLGARLARLEVNTALPALFGRFPGLAPADAPVRRRRLVLRGYQSMPVALA